VETNRFEHVLPGRADVAVAAPSRVLARDKRAGLSERQRVALLALLRTEKPATIQGQP
jgi:hypothetical protein